MEETIVLPAPIVTITVVKGKIVCNPWKLEVKRGTKVKFDYADPFAVHFGGKTPFPHVSFNGSGSIVTEPIPSDMPYGVYKYFIAVYDGTRVLTEDPDIIIVP